MATIEINFADYVRGVRTSAQGAVVLAARLEWAAPSNMNSDEKKALALVVARAGEVKGVLDERDRLGPQRLRPLLNAFANDWSAIYGALSAKARLPSHVGDAGEDAASLVSSLFPDGVSFTQLEAESAWVEGQRRIERITDEKLGKRIEALVGDGFIEAVENSTGELGNALGTGEEKRTIPSSSGLHDSINRFGRAVGAYGRALAFRVDEDDEASVQRFLDAMEPLDIHRAGMRDGSPAPAPTPTPAPAPVPAPTRVVDPAAKTQPAANGTSPGAIPAPTHAVTSTGNVAAPVATSTSNGQVVAPPSTTSAGTTPSPANSSANGANVAA